MGKEGKKGEGIKPSPFDGKWVLFRYWSADLIYYFHT